MFTFTIPSQHFPVGSSQENEARKVSGGGGSRGRVYIYMYIYEIMTNLSCCMAETTTTL